jgi:hypothetical protein
MKPFKNLLLLPPVFYMAIFLAKKNDSHSTIAKQATISRQVLLVYSGSRTGKVNVDFGIHIEMDTSIGMRYDVEVKQGTTVLSHVAFFYKFATPHQSVMYNYATHIATTNDWGGYNARDQKLAVMGQEQVDNYSCTHLQQENTHSVTDYWMSQTVPGFSQFANILTKLDPGLRAMAINGTIFNWGGLVRMKSVFSAEQATSTLTLKLEEVNTDIDFPSKYFDVPSH